jgi:hypothetical protein
MPNEYTSAYAPMQSNAQYGQPMVIGQGQQEAMHQAMLNQQQQYNNQAAQVAGSGNPYGSASKGINPMMMAMALRGGMGNNSVELPKFDTQMSDVAGMGNDTGTGVTYGGINFGQINPMSSGGFGLK